MNKKVLFSVFTLAMFTLGSAAVFACGGGRCGMHRGGEGLEGKFFWKAHEMQEHRQEIGLSDEKADSIKKLASETRKNLIRQQAELEIIEIDLKEKLHANPVDVQGANDLVDQKFEIKKTMLKGLVDSLAKLKGTLTTDQYNKFRTLHEKHGK